MPTLLLQTPREEERGLAKTLFAVGGLKGHAGDHRRVQTQIRQFPAGQGTQFANRLIVHAATFDRGAHRLHDIQGALCNPKGCGAGRIHICHRTQASSLFASAAI